MAKIVKSASAGTLESSDVFVEIDPCESGIEIKLESVVLGQFGDVIRGVIEETLAQQGVTAAHLCVRDRGALDCVIRARVETAVMRGKEDA